MTMSTLFTVAVVCGLKVKWFARNFGQEAHYGPAGNLRAGVRDGDWREYGASRRVLQALSRGGQERTCPRNGASREVESLRRRPY